MRCVFRIQPDTSSRENTRFLPRFLNGIGLGDRGLHFSRTHWIPFPGGSSEQSQRAISPIDIVSSGPNGTSLPASCNDGADCGNTFDS